MKDKVLIRKQSTGPQQFQSVGGQAPSFMDLARRVRDPNAGGMARLGAGLGMAGKVAAGLGTVFQTAHQLQGGNALAPLGMGYTYQGLDPTAGMRNAVSEEQQIADKVNQMRINQRAKEQFEAMQQPQQEAAPSTSTTDFPNQSQRLGEPYGLRDPLAQSPPTAESNVVSQAAESLRAMPFNGGEAQMTDVDPVTPIAQAMAGMSFPVMPNEQVQTYQPVPPSHPNFKPQQSQQQLMPLPTGHNTQQATLQSNYPSQQPQQPQQPHMSPQGNPYPLGTEESRQWAAQQAWGDRPVFTHSFVTQVLDEFGDMLHKADPHVAGLLTFRVYMDKVMKG